ncbi:C40 family peptidase [Hymenobacter convexus]|uniref:C40 family peptidase n=1 Tax=Hymenobacter sp. CA1UV-4 TaxID=3063782 RepID=UPI0027133BD6|nr:C40 family peptidase [Hymenobacter sp. CA1UV-4]MDO7852159.1 C40 family peptidase [Hymenobacter sp. CA1UV-4]
MRFVWMAFAGLIALMVLVLPRLSHRAPKPEAARVPQSTQPSKPVSSFASLREAPRPGPAARADSVVAFGLAQRGTPYVYAGTSPLTGFDCSGFIMYTFAHFGVAVPHSTALLIDVGQPVARAEAQPGDIVVFTGTASTSTTPGHAGIVISRRGEVPLRFVHASSSRREHYVKVSQVEDSDYERRFLQVRRVLGAGEVATKRPKDAPATPPKTPVAALPVPAVPVAAPAAVLAPALPQKLPTKTYTKAHLTTASQRLAASRPSAHKKTTTAAKATAKKTPAKKKVSKPAAKPKATARKRLVR